MAQLASQTMESPLVPASAEGFGDLLDPYRRELLVHCYRMLGSIDDAEDAVQDAFVRAWRGRDTFRQDISFRAWLYRIATNACLDAIERPNRGGGHERSIVIGPLPDDDSEGIDDTEAGPEARYDAHESISLAFTTVLQLLPPRQRAVLILRDVLSWRAAEAAELLELSVPAVNSALHRARTAMAAQYRPTGHKVAAPGQGPARRRTTESRRVTALGQAAGDAGSLEPGALRSLLDRYVRAWEAADIPGLVALLRDDAVLTMPPGLSFLGHAGIADFLAKSIFVDGRQIRLVPIRANGGPGFAAYSRKGSSGPFLGFTVLLLAIDEGGIARIDAFRELSLIPRFGLPEALAS